MNCTDINTHRNEYFEGQLSLLQQRAFEHHLVDCKVCHTAVNDMRIIQAKLYSLAIPEPRNGFVEGVFKEVRRHSPDTSYRSLKTKPFIAGFSTAIAASLVLWFLSTLFIVQQQTITRPDEMMISMNTTQSVRLMFESPSDLDQVLLSIDLPENIELSGYSGQSELSWTTSFEKGKNILSLPVVAIEQGEGEIVAQLRYGDKVKVYHLRIKTVGEGVLNYKMQPFASA